MALTNFGTLTGDQLQTWSRDFWKVARNQSFINQFAGTGSNAMVQRVTELTKNNKGTKANITLLADMTTDGITGDATLEGNEEALRAYDISIELDQLRFANRIAGRMTDQKTVVNFREQSRDALAYAMADRCDQLAFLTLSGAKDQYIRGIRGTGNQETFHMFVTPQQMANLKLDTDFIANVRNAGVRGASNSLFAGSSSLMVDGVMIHEFRHVFNTSGAAAGAKWGADGNVNGGRALFCGAQALALADIGLPEMVEDTFDYGNQSGISVGKIFGLRKPKYHSDITGDAQDFGVICLDTAQ